MDLILYLSVENLPCNSVVNGSRSLFFCRHYNSSLCCVVIKILLFNELSCKMKLIIKKPFMIAFLSAVLIIFFYSSHCCKRYLKQEIINTGVEIHMSQCTCIPALNRKPGYGKIMFIGPFHPLDAGGMVFLLPAVRLHELPQLELESSAL